MTGDLTSRSGVEHHRPPRQAQHPTTKTDEIEVLETAGGEEHQDKITPGWICCAPCFWLRTSATVHKIAITTATLLVTSLLVASPVLFLLSTAPSQLPKGCYTQDDLDCMPTRSPAAECSAPECQAAAISIQTRINWKEDPCKEFRDFSCTPTEGSFKAVKSAQENVDMQMQQLLTHNTTSGLFRKLGRLYGSCLRQTMNSSTIRLTLDDLGGYLPIGALGPSSIAALVSKINDLGPTPLVGLYYDRSYGRQPQVMLIINGPIDAAPVLESPIRWKRPKTPPYRIRNELPIMIDSILNIFLPSGLGREQRYSEESSIKNFIIEFNKIRRVTIRKDFSDSFVTNITMLLTTYPFLNWTDLIGRNWSGPILVRSADYLKSLQLLLQKYPKRVIHNSILVMFALSILPPSQPDAVVCTRATMWAMPEVSSALYVAQFSKNEINNAMERADVIFEVLKAYLKRAPSLKGAALVKLSQLKLRIRSWHVLTNHSLVSEMLEEIEISSDNWFENILRIYESHKNTIDDESIENNHLASTCRWAYPTVATAFYDSLSHSIVVPLSVILVPYFNAKLPPYMHYASVGVSVAKEILRSITKSFDDKVMHCVPASVNIFSNSSRMDMLIHSGGMQISYHSMLSLTGPMKGMLRLPGINLSPKQIFFLVVSQQLCIDSQYVGVNVYSEDFGEILSWLIAQGGSATEAFQCSHHTALSSQKTCNVL